MNHSLQRTKQLGLALQPCFPLLQVHGVCPFVRSWLFARWVWDSNVALLKHLETITLFHLYFKFWLKSRGNNFARSQDWMIHPPGSLFHALAWWKFVEFGYILFCKPFLHLSYESISKSGFPGSNVLYIVRLRKPIVWCPKNSSTKRVRNAGMLKGKRPEKPTPIHSNEFLVDEKHLAISQFQGLISLPTSTRLANIVSLMSHHYQLWVLL